MADPMAIVYCQSSGTHSISATAISDYSWKWYDDIIIIIIIILASFVNQNKTTPCVIVPSFPSPLSLSLSLSLSLVLSDVLYQLFQICRSNSISIATPPSVSRLLSLLSKLTVSTQEQPR